MHRNPTTERKPTTTHQHWYHVTAFRENLVKGTKGINCSLQSYVFNTPYTIMFQVIIIMPPIQRFIGAPETKLFQGSNGEMHCGGEINIKLLVFGRAKDFAYKWQNLQCYNHSFSYFFHWFLFYLVSYHGKLNQVRHMHLSSRIPKSAIERSYFSA